MATVAELLKAGKVRLTREGDVAVTNNAGGNIVLRSNPRRVAFAVVNNEANAAHVVRKSPAATTTGIRLDAAGGALVQRHEVVGQGCQNELWAILETAAGNLYVEEYEVYE